MTDGLSEITYHAVAKNKQASGRTIGEAIDALTPQLEDDDNATTLIVVQKQRPDRFPTAEQQQHGEAVSAQWRAARDANQELPAETQAELEQLVLAEVRAAGQRVAALLQSMAGPEQEAGSDSNLIEVDGHLLFRFNDIEDLDQEIDRMREERGYVPLHSHDLFAC